MAGLGWPELAIIAIIIIALFGWKKLPDMARSLGRSARVFKSEVDEMKKDGKEPSEAARTTVPGDIVEENIRQAEAARTAETLRREEAARNSDSVRRATSASADDALYRDGAADAGQADEARRRAEARVAEAEARAAEARAEAARLRGDSTV